MKKVMKLAALIGAAALIFASCATTEKSAESAEKADTAAEVPTSGEIYSGDVTKNNFILADNHTYGKNYQFQGATGNVLPKDYKAKTGDIIKIHIEGSTNKAIIVGVGDDNDESNKFALWAKIVDTSAAASYWAPLSEQFLATEALDADGTFSYDMEFTITKDAKGKAGSGCANFMIGTSNDQKEAAILTTTKFTYSITRP